uniref:G_PROTEIN_RECEP_F1_2 domain-containing protein n=1 Tax=Steinernema glaseri TaxID=37863 RepID=A0A1I7ZCH5_9BILA
MLLAASMAATVFNVMVIFCAVKLFKRSGDTMHLFIINMTLGDLLLTVFCHPNEFLTRKHEFLRHVDLCAVIHFFNWLGLAVSGLSLTMLNIDKLIYFQWPLRYDQTMSKTRAAVFCIFIWGVSFGFVGYVWIFRIVYVTSDCILQADDGQTEVLLRSVHDHVLCASRNLVALRQHLPVPPDATKDERHDVCRHTSGHAHLQEQDKKATSPLQLRSLVFIFTTTAWTSFSLLPYRIFNICRIHLFEWNSFNCEERGRINWLAWMLLYLLTVNPIVNPVITALIYAPYRMTIKRFLINIPIGNRALYSYRGGENQTDTSFSFLSMRRSRNHRNSSTDHEMSSLRRPDVRVSLNSYDTNWAPIAEEPFIGGDPKNVPPNLHNLQNPLTPAGKKTFVYSDRPKSSTFPSSTLPSSLTEQQ